MTTMQFVLIIITAVSATLATDYCDPKLCDYSPHIACGNDGAFASRCKNPAVVELTRDVQKAILHAHNRLRNRIAGGTSAFQPACRMATMQWDNELAELAALNVKQCKMSHDECHNTVAYKYSGQNLAWMTFYDMNATALSLRSVDMWSNEMRNTKMKYLNKYPSGYGGPTIGHFTVMVADRNIRVGCAAVTYDERSRVRAFLFACNYAQTNIIGGTTYESCSRATSGCKTGRNKKYNNLCSLSEKYNVNYR